MHIDFLDGSPAAHPNFERYLQESTAEGAVPVRFDCAATGATSEAEIGARALDALERRATEEEADILPSTLVATRAEEPSGHRRSRVIVMARRRKPEVERLVVLEPVESP
jgi:hypothetical protein